MKKNKMMRIASVLLIAVLLSTCAISGTFAKYTSEFTGTSTAKVAKWEVSVADQTTETFTFNILETLTDSDGTTEDDVAANLLAPGTKGSFSVVVKNSSEVTAEYTAALTVDSNLPIEFTLATPTGTINMGTEATITVNWEWPFESGDDQADMDLAGEEITASITITVDQVD